MASIEHLVLGRALVNVGGEPAIVTPGLTAIYTDDYPSAINMAATFRMSIPWKEAERAFTVECDIVNEQGATLRQTGQPLAKVVCGFHAAEVDFPSEDVHVSQQVFMEKIKVPAPGRYAVIVLIDGKQMKRSTFRVAKLTGSKEAAARGVTPKT